MDFQVNYVNSFPKAVLTKNGMVEYIHYCFKVYENGTCPMGHGIDKSKDLTLDMIREIFKCLVSVAEKELSKPREQVVIEYSTTFPNVIVRLVEDIKDVMCISEDEIDASQANKSYLEALERSKELNVISFAIINNIKKTTEFLSIKVA